MGIYTVEVGRMVHTLTGKSDRHEAITDYAIHMTRLNPVMVDDETTVDFWAAYLNRFWVSEIGQETAERYLQRVTAKYMEYYKYYGHLLENLRDLYAVAISEYNDLYEDVKGGSSSSTTTGTDHGSSTGKETENVNTESGTTNGRAVSDTPQGQLDGVTALKYLSAYTADNGSQHGHTTREKETGGTTDGTHRTETTGNNDARTTGRKTTAVRISEMLQLIEARKKANTQIINEFLNKFDNLHMLIY